MIMDITAINFAEYLIYCIFRIILMRLAADFTMKNKDNIM